MKLIAVIIGCIVLLCCVDEPVKPITMPPKQKLINSISVYNVAASIDNMVDNGKSLDAQGDITMAMIIFRDHATLVRKVIVS